MPITLADVDADFDREPLARPFGFKGGYLTEIWQAVARLSDPRGRSGTGLGAQSVLWSDARVFAAHSESGGNALMFALTEYALQRARGRTFVTPLDLLDALLPDVLDYGRRLTGFADLRTTFALNALVPVDNAAWVLYARHHGIGTFDALIPDAYRPALSHRHHRVACIPVVSYPDTAGDIESLVEDGFFFLKIKLGHPGTQDDMLQADMDKLTLLHDVLGDRACSHTATGRMPYYLDANGRYEREDTLKRLIDHADAIGALPHVVLIEEPFPESVTAPVGDLGVTIAADESAHTDEEVRRRIDLGYGAIALKPIAKTLSMTLRMAAAARAHQVPCFCADLTVNPILVDWNKNVAARLAPFPGLDLALLETNGHQNYRDWDRMASYHPAAGAPWTRIRDGLFYLDEAFFHDAGGILRPSAHYDALFDPLPHKKDRSDPQDVL